MLKDIRMANNPVHFDFAEIDQNLFESLNEGSESSPKYHSCIQNSSVKSYEPKFMLFLNSNQITAIQQHFMT